METEPFIKICLHYENMPVPKRGHDTDVGIDLTVMSVEQRSSEIFFFDTGISIQLSKGYYAEIVPRSSIIKTDFFLANSVGIIDPDYRGHIFMPFRYIGKKNGLIEANKLINKRFGQLIVRKLEACNIKIVNTLEETERGVNGFGSTGM